MNAFTLKFFAVSVVTAYYVCMILCSTITVIEREIGELHMVKTEELERTEKSSSQHDLVQN